MKDFTGRRVRVEYIPGGAGSIAGFIVSPLSGTRRAEKAAAETARMLQGKRWRRMVARGVFARKLQTLNKEYWVRLWKGTELIDFRVPLCVERVNSLRMSSPQGRLDPLVRRRSA